MEKISTVFSFQFTCLGDILCILFNLLWHRMLNYIYRTMYVFRIVVSCTVCGNQEVIGSNPVAPLMGVVAQMARALELKHTVNSLQLYSICLALSSLF